MFKHDIIASLLPNESREHLVDLTGGLGVDCAFLSPLFRRTDYVEQSPGLCLLACHNFPLLGLHHVHIHACEAGEYLDGMEAVSLIYIDPARRGTGGGKVISLADCSPDITRLQDIMLAKSRYVLAKLSSMLDVTHTLRTLKGISHLYVVSVRNECKELLVVMQPQFTAEPQVHAVNITADSRQVFSFVPSEARQAVPVLTGKPGQWLYEPHPALMKAGCFGLLCHRFPVSQLDVNSHLFTADACLPDWPGRIFRVKGVSGMGRNERTRLLQGITQAHVAVRNGTCPADQLRTMLRLKEGGSVYLFATAIGRRKVLILAEKPEAMATHPV